MAKKLTAAELHRLARIGAEARLAQLEREIAALRRAFPGLRSRPGPASAPATEAPPQSVPGATAARRGRRKPMSATERKAVSERMKRYWDARRKSASK